MDVAAWLDDLGLSSYADLFADAAIDQDVLGELTEDHLKELGLPLGHRLKLLKAIAKLNGTGPGPATALRENGPTAAELVRNDGAEAPPTDRSLEAERRHLTVMFCDLVDSTGMSARLDPEDMRELILVYQNAAAGIIARYEGHVAKFMGDGVLAYFGWPRAHEDAGERAVRAGRSIVAAMRDIQTPFGTPLAVRIGIATGLVVVGDLIGEGEAQERSVVGDTPNLAARLQHLAEPGQIVIAASTRRLIGDTFELGDLGQRQFKGIAEAVGAWKVLGEGSAEGRFEALRGKILMPLVGREEELDLLLRRWELTKEGRGQVVLLTGEPGIGKSRLGSALRERLREESKRDVRMFCSHYHANSALYPTIAHFERAARWGSEDTAETKLEKLEGFVGASGLEPAEVLPLVAAMMSLPAGEHYAALDLDPRAQKLQTLSALVSMIEGFSADRPLLMIVEDAHWLDPTSIELFDLVIERIATKRVFLLITFRPEFKTHWTGPAHVATITLNRLGQVDGAAIIDRVTGGKALPQEVLQHILSKTDGIPLFVEELTRTVLETGLLIDAGDHYELSEPLSAFSIPNSLQDSLMARLDRLAPAREIAQIAACIGREFHYTLLATVAAFKSRRELDAALNSLVASELIFAHGVAPDAVYKFKHALIQDAAYQTLLKTRRVSYHQRIARALEQMFPEVAASEPEVIAHHYTKAREPEKAIDYWMRAGRKAMAGSGNLEAIEHFSRALKQIEEMRPSSARDRQELEILIALAVPLTSAKGYASAELDRTYTRARDLCRQMGETPNLFPVLYGLWRFYLLRADYRQARELAVQLSEMAQQSDDPVFDIAAHRAMGATLFYVGEIEESLAHLQRVTQTPATEEARSRILTFDVADPWVASHAYSGWTHWLLGYPDRARQESERAIALAADIGHKFSIALSKCFAAWTYQFCGDRRRTAEIAGEGLQFSRDNAFQFWIGWAEVLVAWASSDAPERKSEAIRAGLENWRATESRLGFSYFLCLLGEARSVRGHSDAARASIEDAAEFADHTGELWWRPEIQRVSCELLSVQSGGQPDEAIACLTTALASARAMRAKALELRLALALARLQASRRGIAAARETISNVLGEFTEGFDTEDLRNAQTFLQELPQGG